MNRLRDTRKQLEGVTCRRAAKWFDVKYATINAWENGTRSVSERNLNRLMTGYAALAASSPDVYADLDKGNVRIDDLAERYRLKQVMEKASPVVPGKDFAELWPLIPERIREDGTIEDLAKLMEALYMQGEGGKNESV